MDDLNRRDLDVWTFDFAGFGGSGREVSFLSDDADAPAYGRATEAAEQIVRVLREIQRRVGRCRVSILAHSWGTIPACLVAETWPDLLDRLVLFGPVVTRSAGAPPSRRGSSVQMSIEDQRRAFAAGTPDGLPNMEPDDFDRWSAAYLGTDPTALRRSPPSVRVPSGPALDIEQARAGFCPYDPDAITCPTLIVRGEWDVVATEEDVARLAAAMTFVRTGAELVTLPQGGHRMHLERSRALLFDTVGGFLAC